METIEIIPVKNHAMLREFIMLPKRLHAGHLNWIPPVYRDEWNYHNSGRNPALGYCETMPLLAYKDRTVAGRIMGVINHRYNEEKRVKTARFCLFESVNNQLIAHQLFQYTEHWAIQKGMNEIIGPFGLYYHDPIGFMVEGFEQIPALTTYSNFSFINQLVENEGYSIDKELKVYKIIIRQGIPEIYRKLRAKVAGNSNVRLVEFKHRSDMDHYIYPVLKLMNEAYAEIYGYSQLDEGEMFLLAKQYLKLLDPDLVKIVLYQEEVAGFIIAMPNISKGLIASKGYLYPFGIFSILAAARKSKQLDLLIGAIKKKYQGLGIDVLLGIAMFETAHKRGFEFMDSHLEMESNVKIRAEMEKVGGEVYKRYRLYKKALA